MSTSKYLMRRHSQIGNLKNSLVHFLVTSVLCCNSKSGLGKTVHTGGRYPQPFVKPRCYMEPGWRCPSGSRKAGLAGLCASAKEHSFSKWLATGAAGSVLVSLVSASRAHFVTFAFVPQSACCVTLWISHWSPGGRAGWINHPKSDISAALLENLSWFFLTVDQSQAGISPHPGCSVPINLMKISF